MLMVAEKPSLARSLAEILSHKQCNRRKSMCSACDVYEWTGSFPSLRANARFKMTSVCGHVMSLDFPAKYNKWDQIDPVSSQRVNCQCVHLLMHILVLQFTYMHTIHRCTHICCHLHTCTLSTCTARLRCRLSCLRLRLRKKKPCLISG